MLSQGSQAGTDRTRWCTRDCYRGYRQAEAQESKPIKQTIHLTTTVDQWHGARTEGLLGTTTRVYKARPLLNPKTRDGKHETRPDKRQTRRDKTSLWGTVRPLLLFGRCFLCCFSSSSSSSSIVSFHDLQFGFGFDLCSSSFCLMYLISKNKRLRKNHTSEVWIGLSNFNPPPRLSLPFL
jgi:hypothetical protein